MKKTYVVASVKLESDLKKRLKMLSVQLDIEMQQLLNDFLRQGLEQLEKKEAKKNG